MTGNVLAVRILLMLAVAFFGSFSAFAQSSTQPGLLKVAIKPIEPFVTDDAENPQGFSIELWDLIAEQNGWQSSYVFVPTLGELFDGVRKGDADLAIAAVSITAEREAEFDFSHSYFRSGLRVMVASGDGGDGIQIWAAVRDLFWSKGFLIAAIVFLASVLVVSHITWFLERKTNPQFSPHYPHGVWDAFWWAIVTITTVGYGDKAPSGVRGKLFALFWMIFGYFMFAYFTAVVTSTVTVQELRGSISGPDDLFGRPVAVIDKSTSARFLERRGQEADLVRVERIEEAYAALRDGQVEAVVHDAPVLQYYAQRAGRGNVRLVGATFNNDEYGVVLPRGSALREDINRTILRLRENGQYGQLYAKWFGRQQ
ncbi:transporter substrate-binding domain-containing protein [Pseudahrensia aquimaris]|uniref:Transporter substrate-binding domain-containing protein n=1 Tax=Pseudahrensia aquimaris TaxID=744461 RepID=A0ABW3FKD1_9HYPH